VTSDEWCSAQRDRRRRALGGRPGRRRCGHRQARLRAGHEQVPEVPVVQLHDHDVRRQPRTVFLQPVGALDRRAPGVAHADRFESRDQPLGHRTEVVPAGDLERLSERVAEQDRAYAGAGHAQLVVRQTHRVRARRAPALGAVDDPRVRPDDPAVAHVGHRGRGRDEPTPRHDLGRDKDKRSAEDGGQDGTDRSRRVDGTSLRCKAAVFETPGPRGVAVCADGRRAPRSNREGRVTGSRQTPFAPGNARDACPSPAPESVSPVGARAGTSSSGAAAGIIRHHPALWSAPRLR
jgi:hypothetical protein